MSWVHAVILTILTFTLPYYSGPTISSLSTKLKGKETLNLITPGAHYKVVPRFSIRVSTVTIETHLRSHQAEER